MNMVIFINNKIMKILHCRKLLQDGIQKIYDQRSDILMKHFKMGHERLRWEVLEHYPQSLFHFISNFTKLQSYVKLSSDGWCNLTNKIGERESIADWSLDTVRLWVWRHFYQLFWSRFLWKLMDLILHIRAPKVHFNRQKIGECKNMNINVEI